MRAAFFVFALIAPGAVQVWARRVRRGIFWVALMLASLPTVRWTPWLVLLPWLAQAVDAALLPEKKTDDREAVIFGFIANGILIGSALLIRSLWVEMFDAPTGSMIPALQANDHFAIDKTVHHARRGDIVVFTHPHQADVKLVKRVIAVGGDTIELRDGVVVLNGQPVPRQPVPGDCKYEDFSEVEGRWEQRGCEDFLEQLDGRRYHVLYDPGVSGARSAAPVSVPAGTFYVLGDNRDNSMDSRFFGTVPEANLLGRATYIYWSSGRGGIRWSRLQKRVP
jgi:signal peptidase I